MTDETTTYSNVTSSTSASSTVVGAVSSTIERSDSSVIGPIVGGVLAAVVVIAVIIVPLIVCWRNKRGGNDADDASPSNGATLSSRSNALMESARDEPSIYAAGAPSHYANPGDIKRVAWDAHYNDPNTFTSIDKIVH